jgi:hypothetical protein
MTTPSSTSLLCICGDPQCIVPFGLCHCGCNESAPLATRTRRELGHIKGKPVRTIRSHNSTKPRPTFADALPFKIDGDYCKLIPLTKGQFHVVDASEYEHVSKIIWSANWSDTVKSFYGYNTRFGKLHRYLLGLAKGDPRTGDHVDPSRTWDNRLRNLRIANHSEQGYNQRRKKSNTSGYKGVSWNKTCKKYQASITTMGRTRRLGFDDDPRICAEMYRVAALEEHGEFARVS